MSRTVWGVILIIFSLLCWLRRRDAQKSGWHIGKWYGPRGPMPKIGPGGRSGAARPADRPVDARLKRPHNVPREGTSKRVFPSMRRLRRPDAQESGGSITGWYEPMGTIPFNRSRGRLAAGKASDRSGVVVRHTTTSRVLGGWILRYRVGARDLLLKRAAVLSPDGTGRWVRCRRSGRQTD